MSEPDDDEGTVDIRASGIAPDGSAVFRVESGFVVLAGGCDAFCARLGADAIQIDNDGEVWCLDTVEQEWLTAERAVRKAAPSDDGNVTTLPVNRTRQ